MLFRVGAAPPRLTQRIELFLTLPLGHGAPVVRVRCKGHVVRAAPSGFPGGGYDVGVAIEGYALQSRLVG
jgi:hypothetical protein